MSSRKPQTSEMNGDYVNEYAYWLGILELDNDDISVLSECIDAIRSTRDKVILFYHERPHSYSLPTGKRDLGKIRELNLIAMGINKLVESRRFTTSLTPNDCRSIVSRVCQLIYGDSQTRYSFGPPIAWEREIYKKL